jgi:hypothetical protein
MPQVRLMFKWLRSFDRILYPAFDDRHWHDFESLWPRRDHDTGRLIFGLMLRKRVNDRWVYKAREETAEEWADRQM